MRELDPPAHWGACSGRHTFAVRAHRRDIARHNVDGTFNGIRPRYEDDLPNYLRNDELHNPI